MKLQAFQHIYGSVRMTYLSHNHYAISDKAAGQLARAHVTAKRLPRRGYEVDVPFPGSTNGRAATLKRTVTTYGEKSPNNRGWVWTLMPHGFDPLP